MDKYEYQICLQDIKEKAAAREFYEAKEVADTVEWRRVKSVKTLCLVSDVYRACKEYNTARRLLMMAYEKEPENPKIIYSLCTLEIKTGQAVRALQFYQQYIRVAPSDPTRFRLQYQLYESQGVGLQERIQVLEQYRRYAFDEKFVFLLSELYEQAGQKPRSDVLLDEIITRDGRLAMKALEKKKEHGSLTNEQFRLYRERTKPAEPELRYSVGAAAPKAEPAPARPAPGAAPAPEMEVRTPDTSLANTANLREMVAEGVREVLETEPSETEVRREAEAQRESARAAFQEGFDVKVSARRDTGRITEEEYDRARALREQLRAQAARDEAAVRSHQEQRQDVYESLMAQETSGQLSFRMDVPGARRTQMPVAAPAKPKEEVKPEEILAGVRAEMDRDMEEESRRRLKETTGPIMEAFEEAVSHDPVDEIDRDYAAGERARRTSEMMPQGGELSDGITDEERRSAAVAKSEPLSSGEKDSVLIRDTLVLDEAALEAATRTWEGPDVVEAARTARRVQDTPVREVEEEVYAPAEPERLPEAVRPAEEEDPLKATADLEDYLSQELGVKVSAGRRREEAHVYEETDPEISAPEAVRPEPAELEAVRPARREAEPAPRREAAPEPRPIPAPEPEVLPEPEPEPESWTEDMPEHEVSYEEPEETFIPTEEPEEEIIRREAPVEEIPEELPEDEEYEAPEKEPEEEPEVEPEEEPEEEVRPARKPARKEKAQKKVSRREEAEEDEAEDASEDEAEAEAKGAEKEGRRGSSDRDRIRRMSHEQRKAFAPFLHERATRKAVLAAMDHISMASYTGNVIITGGEGDNTLGLAKAFLKDIKTSDSNFTGRVASVDADMVNTRGAGTIVRKLLGGGVIIDKAASLTQESAEQLHSALEAEDRAIVVILIDDKKAMDRFLSKNPDLEQNFNARVDIRSMSDEDLMELARRYAKTQDCVIDDMAVLALHSRIAAMQAGDHQVTAKEIRSIVDEAIKYAEKFTPGHLMDSVIGKRYDDDDYLILKEKDFTHYDI